MTPERPQEYRDLLRLMATIRDTHPRDPERRSIRAQLLAKLSIFVEMPTLMPGGMRLA